jgi:hypothetical protein
MINSNTKQARRDARNLQRLSRLALRTLDKAHRTLRRRGHSVLAANRGWDGPDPLANEKLYVRVVGTIEPLDECLDAVATRRALARMREPTVKETRSQRRARKCEKVAGYGLRVLLSLQEALDEGEWTDAVVIAREGARELESRIECLFESTTPVVEDALPVAEPPSAPDAGKENAA